MEQAADTGMDDNRGNAMKMKDLKEKLESGSYQVDEQAVATAILRSPLLAALLRRL